MVYFAGIDGGQSTTVAVVADENGRILGRGNAGAADEIDQGADSTKLRDALTAALTDASAHANLPHDVRFAAIVAGISGYEGQVYGQPPSLPTDALALLHDTRIAHAGALAGSAGVIVIAGTGSVAYAVNEHGASALVGGWGYVFGDEGSAFWLARKALGGAMHGSDSGEPVDLTQIALQYFNMPSLRALARAFYAGTISRTQLASFAAVVVQQAEDCDEQASAYVKNGARALVTLAMHGMDRVGMPAAEVAFTGGLLQSGTVRDEIAQWMDQLLPQATHVQPRYDPAVGALLLAYKNAGVAVPANIAS